MKVTRIAVQAVESVNDVSTSAASARIVGRTSSYADGAVDLTLTRTGLNEARLKGQLSRYADGTMRASAHRDHQDRIIVITQIGARDHRDRSS